MCGWPPQPQGYDQLHLQTLAEARFSGEDSGGAEAEAESPQTIAEFTMSQLLDIDTSSEVRPCYV